MIKIQLEQIYEKQNKKQLDQQIIDEAQYLQNQSIILNDNIQSAQQQINQCKEQIQYANSLVTHIEQTDGKNQIKQRYNQSKEILYKQEIIENDFQDLSNNKIENIYHDNIEAQIFQMKNKIINMQKFINQYQSQSIQSTQYFQILNDNDILQNLNNISNDKDDQSGQIQIQNQQIPSQQQLKCELQQQEDKQQKQKCNQHSKIKKQNKELILLEKALTNRIKMLKVYQNELIVLKKQDLSFQNKRSQLSLNLSIQEKQINQNQSLQELLQNNLVKARHQIELIVKMNKSLQRQVKNIQRQLNDLSTNQHKSLQPNIIQVRRQIHMKKSIQQKNQQKLRKLEIQFNHIFIKHQQISSQLLQKQQQIHDQLNVDHKRQSPKDMIMHQNMFLILNKRKDKIIKALNFGQHSTELRSKQIKLQIMKFKRLQQQLVGKQKQIDRQNYLKDQQNQKLFIKTNISTPKKPVQLSLSKIENQSIGPTKDSQKIRQSTKQSSSQNCSKIIKQNKQEQFQKQNNEQINLLNVSLNVSVIQKPDDFAKFQTPSLYKPSFKIGNKDKSKIQINQSILSINQQINQKKSMQIDTHYPFLAATQNQQYLQNQQDNENILIQPIKNQYHKQFKVSLKENTQLDQNRLIDSVDKINQIFQQEQVSQNIQDQQFKLIQQIIQNQQQVSLKQQINNDEKQTINNIYHYNDEKIQQPIKANQIIPQTMKLTERQQTNPNFRITKPKFTKINKSVQKQRSIKIIKRGSQRQSYSLQKDLKYKVSSSSSSKMLKKQFSPKRINQQRLSTQINLKNRNLSQKNQDKSIELKENKSIDLNNNKSVDLNDNKNIDLNATIKRTIKQKQMLNILRQSIINKSQIQDQQKPTILTQKNAQLNQNPKRYQMQEKKTLNTSLKKPKITFNDYLLKKDEISLQNLLNESNLLIKKNTSIPHLYSRPTSRKNKKNLIHKNRIKEQLQYEQQEIKTSFRKNNNQSKQTNFSLQAISSKQNSNIAVSNIQIQNQKYVPEIKQQMDKVKQQIQHTVDRIKEIELRISQGGLMSPTQNHQHKFGSQTQRYSESINKYSQSLSKFKSRRKISNQSQLNPQINSKIQTIRKPNNLFETNLQQIGRKFLELTDSDTEN